MIVELARRVSSCGWVALCARRRAGFARLSSWQPVGNWVALAANFGHKGAVTIDLRQMGKVKEVDKTSRAALIEGGTYGPSLEAQLKPHGLTLRHFPQSFEYSTLGGWIATRGGG